MYASDLVVGARSREAVEQALRTVLPGLGLAVTESVDVANLSERYERRGHDASISIGSIDGGFFTIAVRGPRAPQWNNELARRLSQVLGGWAASCVSDRTLDDYGYGYFLDGLTIEAAVRAGSKVLDRVGFLRDEPDRIVLDSLDEERNQRNFAAALENLAGRAVDPWPPTGSIRVLFVEGAGAAATTLVRPPSTLLVAAGHQERIDVPGFEQEVFFDGRDVRVLVARTSLPKWELTERLEAVPCTAFFTSYDDTYVRLPDEELASETVIYDLRSAIAVWNPITFATGLSPMAFTFDAARPTSPWR